MQNIIDKQEKEIEKLKQTIEENKNEYFENYNQLKQKYNTEIDLLSGVEVENKQVIKSNSKNAMLLQSIRFLMERVPENYKRMYVTFEEIVKKDIKNKKTYSSLTVAQRDVIKRGLKLNKTKFLN